MHSQLSIDLIEKICRTSSVIACVSAPDLTDADRLAQTLVDNGVSVVEVSTNSANFQEVISAMAAIDGLLVGAGDVLTASAAKEAVDAGAQYCSSPGVTDTLLRYFDGVGTPYLPGATTASEVMKLIERGYAVQRCFPAATIGGPGAIAAMSDPLPQVSFCAAGSITAENAADYLALKNVLCVAVDWIATEHLISEKDWKTIAQRARIAGNLKSGV